MTKNEMYRRRLPHWRAEDSIYFVTWRLERTQRELSAEERELIAAALRKFDSQRYHLLGYVVMNDHVHAMVKPVTQKGLTGIVHSWKSYTANRLQRGSGRTGRIWQREYFDRVIRDEAELEGRLDYILGNPGKRWPEIESYPWVWVEGL